MTEAKATAARLIKREESILIIIDIQEKLLPVMAEKEQVLQNAVRLVKFANIVRLPVVVTEQDKLGETVPEIKDELTKAEVFGKITFDCFGEEAFRAHLGLTGRRNLILAGIESHICVAQTALRALDNYSVHVVADAVSSRTPHNKEVALNRLRANGVTITSTEMVIYEILRQAGTTEFREILKLVK